MQISGGGVNNNDTNYASAVTMLMAFLPVFFVTPFGLQVLDGLAKNVCRELFEDICAQYLLCQS